MQSALVFRATERATGTLQPRLWACAATTGITAYLANDGQLDKAQQVAAHASSQTTKLDDRRAEEASLVEAERIIL